MDKPGSRDYFKLTLFGSFVAAIVALLFYFLNFSEARLSAVPGDWSSFGSYMGGVIGCIFSFTGVVLLVMTFRRQQQTSILQQFESTFFNLLNIQREMMKSVRCQKYGDNDFVIILKGQDVFEYLAATLQSDFATTTATDDREIALGIINEVYEDVYEIAPVTLGPYYRHLAHFMKYTNTSHIYGQKQKYMDMIQAQMSDAELYCLFYNAICFGSKNVFPMLETYSFLENIERKSLLFDIHKTMFYPKTAFKYHTKASVAGEIEN